MIRLHGERLIDQVGCAADISLIKRLPRLAQAGLDPRFFGGRSCQIEQIQRLDILRIEQQRFSHASSVAS